MTDIKVSDISVHNIPNASMRLYTAKGTTGGYTEFQDFVDALAIVPEDYVWIPPVLDRLSAPPGGESEGDRYLVVESSAWYDYEWNYRRELTTDSSKIFEDETDAVVRIEINGADNIFTNAQADGDDILFTASDGITKLDHFIEVFDNSNQYFVAFVRIPSLDKDANSTFYLYYGNSTCENQEATTDVFNSNYGLFYDMNQADPVDRTINGRSYYGDVGDPAGNTDTYGTEVQFDGDDAWNLQDIDYWEQEWSIRTHSAVFKTGADITTRQTILAEGGGTNGCLLYIRDSKIYARWWSESKGWGGDHLVTDTTAPGVAADGTISTNTAYYVTIVYSYPGNYSFYVNGVEQDTAVATTVAINAHGGNGGIAYTGTYSKDFDNGSASGQYFTGDIREVVITDDAWSLNRHKTWYNNAADNSNFWTVGAESEPSGATGGFSGHDNEIAEYISGAYTFTVAVDGTTTWVEDENKHYAYDLTNDVWKPLTGQISHDSLTNVQGGSTTQPLEQYHMTEREYAVATRDATNTQNGLMPAGKLNIWDLGYYYRLEAVDADSGTAVPEDARFTIAGGTGMDTSGSDDTITVAFDSTEIGTTTWGSGSAITWTFNASGGTDVTIAFGDDIVNITGNVGILSQKELRFYEGANYVGFEAPALSADQIWVLPTEDGNDGDVLTTNGSGTLSFTDPMALARTDVVSYIDLEGADDDGILTLRVFQIETVNEGSLDGQINYPRCIVVELTPPSPTDQTTGDVQINGLDANGDTISETLSMDANMGTDTETTDKAFIKITSVVVSNVSGDGGATYIVGWNDTVGYPNYPWGATTDIFKILWNAAFVQIGSLTINATYGTVKFDDIATITTGDDIVIFIRVNK